MLSPLVLSDLVPAVSIFPLRLLPGVQSTTAAEDLFGKMEELVTTDPRSGETRPQLATHEILPVMVKGGWNFTGAIYQLDQSPSWIRRLPKGVDDSRAGFKTQYRQRNWHLALVGLKRTSPDIAWAIVHATQEQIAAILREWLIAGRFGTSRLTTPVATVFSNETLQAVGLEGDAKQTALAGVHRSIATKPDRKTLLGLDLRQAVDPFADQTYRLTSAVSRSDQRVPDLLGLSLNAQRLWSSRSRDFVQFAAVLDSICDRLEQTERLAPAGPAVSRRGLGQPGYSSLARPEAPAEIHNAREAFDAAFRPATDLDPLDGPVDDRKQRLEQLELAWFSDGAVTLVEGSPHDASFRLRVAKARRHLLDLTITPAPDEGSITLPMATTYAAGVSPDDPSVELFEQLIEGDGLGARLAVWFDSGHVLVQNQVSTLTYQDVLFEEWRWRSFHIAGTDYRVDQEKPMRPSATPGREVADLDAIGAAQSLFDYSLADIPGLMGNPADLWAICDDGAGEVADFVFFDQAGKRLWLVHAKAADSDAAARKISVSAYEQVVSQARKNLRYLDGSILAAEIRKRDAGLPRLWRNGVKVADPDHGGARATICDALQAMRFFEEKVLVVLQPHVRKASWDAARADLSAGRLNTIGVKSYRLLCALLADLQMTAQKVGAKLMVIGDAN